MKQITRDDLIRSKGQLETVLSALEGTGPEMTDREAFVALTRAVWQLFDFIIRRTWGI